MSNIKRDSAHLTEGNAKREPQEVPFHTGETGKKRRQKVLIKTSYSTDNSDTLPVEGMGTTSGGQWDRI